MFIFSCFKKARSQPASPSLPPPFSTSLQGVSLCSPSWFRTPGLKRSFCLCLTSSWGYIQVNITALHFLSLYYCSMTGHKTRKVDMWNTDESDYSPDNIPTSVLHIKTLVYSQAYFQKEHHYAKSWQMKVCFEVIHDRQSQSIQTSHHYRWITGKMKYSTFFTQPHGAILGTCSNNFSISFLHQTDWSLQLHVHRTMKLGWKQASKTTSQISKQQVCRDQVLQQGYYLLSVTCWATQQS